MTTVEESEECVKCGHSMPLSKTVEEREPCPKCGSKGRKRIVVVNERIIRSTRQEQVKKRPYLVILSFVLGFLAILVGFFDHPLVMIAQILLGVWTLALLPINKNIEGISNELF